MNTSKIKRSIWVLVVLLSLHHMLISQDCLPPSPNNNVKGGKVVLVYGATTSAVNPKNSSSIILGQPATNQANNTDHVSDFGFYSQFLLPPLPPVVTASQGEFLDRIQVSWSLDPLGSSPSEGFNIYRDGVFIDQVGPKIRNYNDFNVIAGRPYTYTVSGINPFGEGRTGTGLGFQVPNGVVTGYVRTINDRAVPDALVTLLPMQGFSTKLGQMDAAVAIKDAVQPNFLPPLGEDWTVAFWMKTESVNSANPTILSMSGSNFRIMNYFSSSNISVNQQGAFPLVIAPLPKNQWHHVAFSYEGVSGNGRLYVDGALQGTAPFAQVPSPDSLFIGQRYGINGWAGRIDEFRIYHTLLNELDLHTVMEGTASKSTPFLTHYWKFDEELGEKSFDIISRHPMYFCGAQFDADRPPVRTSAMTDEEGYYQIEGVNYGTGTTFIATPEKDFLMHRSLEFKANESDLVTLPNFGLPSKSTMEFWIYNTSTTAGQTFFSKGEGHNNFKVFIAANNELRLAMNSGFGTFGTLPPGFNHVAFTIDSTTNQVKGYINGGTPIVRTINVPSNWSDTTTLWHVGGNINNTQYFDGLIDEIAIYDTILSQAAIQAHAQGARDMTEDGLLVYFPFDEGSGNLAYNVGSIQMPPGNIMGAKWSNYAAIQETSPHEFSPKTRQVTLNPSVTSVDQVDFIDRSTIAVSGFVRFQGTDCFQPNIEILVNGESFSPPIFTDSLGKFIVDFDPGFTGVLSPKFEDHTYSPASWEVINVSTPVAGILFTNTVKRKIEGKVAGGLCELPILDFNQGDLCKVKLSTTDGCFERTITIGDVAGDFIFENLPPIENYTLTVTEHSDPDIKSYFEVAGGLNLDLSTQDTSVKMLYFAPPEVAITSGLDVNSCGIIVLDKGTEETISIAMKEVYVGGECIIDTGFVRIINGFADETKDTVISMGSVDYTFTVGDPNPSPPYLKTMQIIVTSLAGRDASITKQGVMTGVRQKASTFLSTTPSAPLFVLRDPPGDGSYSFFEKDSTICKTISYEFDTVGVKGFGLYIDFFPDLKYVSPVGYIYEIEGQVGPNVSFAWENTRMSNNSMETCFTANSRISTRDDDLIIGGQGADVYVGYTQNIVFGNGDMVLYDPNTCEIRDSQVVVISPGPFKSMYVYSEFYIENTILPNLSALKSSVSDPDSIAQFLQDSTTWHSYITDNKAKKENLKVNEIITFDAGATYEYSITNGFTESSGIEFDTSFNFETEFIVDIQPLGFGAGGRLFINGSDSRSKSNDESTSKGITTGFVLSDDDPLDAYAIEIGEDGHYKTPIFKIKAGQSSCPWEEGTANREAPNLQLAPGSQFVQTDVPANEQAVFQFQLGNLSATNEDWTYTFGAIPANNPHGAIIKLNGQPLNNNAVDYIIKYGESQLVTLTVEKGPKEYDYDSLLVALYSGCELARNYALSLGLTDDPKFFSPIYIGAHFIRPCSEVDINVPQQDWVLYNSLDTPDEMNVTVSGYDTTETSFKLIRVQYRKTNGDGAWINIDGVSDIYNGNWSGYDTLPTPKPPRLGSKFTQFTWNTTGLQDGNYEIRAVAVCTGDASDKPGFSQTIKGRIDRQPPALLGVPQPSDGVYHVGDEISFTFNQDIDCDKLIQADMSNVNNVGLYDATTGDLIDVNISCKDNKIIINPNFQNEFFENKILRAELHNIKDLVGNNMVEEIWEFYVDRNELAWLSDSIFMTKYDDESKTITAKIHNRGGYPVPYTLQNIPSWMHVVPSSGTLVANEIEEVSFTVKDDLPIGTYIDSIIMHTETGANPFFMGGDEVLMMQTRVICRPPVWVVDPEAFDPSSFNFSMNYIVELDIEGELSTDTEDIVGAYVNGELRGVSKVQYKPGLGYVAFLTAYSNSPSGETIEFQIWDASTCQLYADIVESFPFADNTIIGSSQNPTTLHTSGKILRKIYIHPGWNWISMNLDLIDPSVNGGLESLTNPNGATIKAQSSFSQYSANLNQWIGSLSTLGPQHMYQYFSQTYDSISMVGLHIDSLGIPIQVGWNWIGYIPNHKLPVGTALASLNPEHGDLLKGRLTFAVYDTIIGWVGNLTYMDEPNGYLYKSSVLDTLIYPPSGSNFTPGTGTELSRKAKVEQQVMMAELMTESKQSLWQIDPSKFEYSMNFIAIVKNMDGNHLLKKDDEIGVFSNGELRGSSHPIYIPQLGQHIFFMTVYGHGENENLQLKYHSISDDKIYDIYEEYRFTINEIIGTSDEPEHFHLLDTSTGISEALAQQLVLYPNPFSEGIYIKNTKGELKDVQIYIRNVDGQIVYSRSIDHLSNGTSLLWKPGNGITNGNYVIEIISVETVLHKNVIYIR